MQNRYQPLELTEWIQSRIDFFLSYDMSYEGLSPERADRIKGDRAGYIVGLVTAKNHSIFTNDAFNDWLNAELRCPTVNIAPSTLFNTHYLRGHPIGYIRALNECKAHMLQSEEWADLRRRAHYAV
jgi:hypothetical protein